MKDHRFERNFYKCWINDHVEDIFQHFDAELNIKLYLSGAKLSHESKMKNWYMDNILTTPLTKSEIVMTRELSAIRVPKQTFFVAGSHLSDEHKNSEEV